MIMAQSFGNGRQPAITRKIIEERKASTQNFSDAPPVDHAVGVPSFDNGPQARLDRNPDVKARLEAAESELETARQMEVPSAGERQREGVDGQMATELQGEGGLSDSQHE